MTVKAALGWLGRNAAALLAGGVFAGLIAPPLAALLRPLLVPVIVLILAVTLVRLDWGAMAGYARRPGLVALGVIWLMVVSPTVVWAVAVVFAPPPALLAALTLTAAAPPIMATAVFALILGLDAPLAIVVATAATIATPFTLPLLALMLLGLELDIGLAEFSLRLAFLIGGAFAIAFAARRAAPAGWIDDNATQLDGLAVILLLTFAIGIMDGVMTTLVERAGYVALCTAAAFALNLGLQAAGALAFAPLGRRRALTFGLTSGYCNMGLVLAVLADKADFDVVVFFAMGQLPMYVLPLLLRPVYRRLLPQG